MFKQRTTIGLIISTLIMLASFATLFLFFKIIANKNEHTSAVIVTLSNKMARKDNIDQLKKKITEVDAIKTEIDQHFVDSKTIDSFVGYLEGLGTRAGTEVKVESFDPSPANPRILLVRITSSGTFSHIMNTIMLLENSPYQVHITRTALTEQLVATDTVDKAGKKTTTNTPTWQATVSFSILTSQ